MRSEKDGIGLLAKLEFYDLVIKLYFLYYTIYRLKRYILSSNIIQICKFQLKKNTKNEKVSSLTAGNFSLLTNLIQTYEKKMSSKS